MYTHTSNHCPLDIHALPGDIFAHNWDQNTNRYVMGLFEWHVIRDGTRHPEEPDFVYEKDWNDLTNEGWFLHPLSDEGMWSKSRWKSLTI